MLLPCSHSARSGQEIASAIELLRNLHTLHPEVLTEHNITPDSYIDGYVFRSAVESIRGTYIASSQRERESFVGRFLEAMKHNGLIYDYQYTGKDGRCDYHVNAIENYLVGLEVKGGEGNSIQISDRPEGAQEFACTDPQKLDTKKVNLSQHHDRSGRRLPGEPIGLKLSRGPVA